MESIRPFPPLASFGDVFFAFFRAALGLLLLVRGINFVFDLPRLIEMVSVSRFNFNAELLAYIISIFHLVGGCLIVVGLITRMALIAQIPILVAAVIFNFESNVFSTTPELALSIVVLVLLIYYLVKGPGIISMDHYRYNNPV